MHRNDMAIDTGMHPSTPGDFVRYNVFPDGLSATEAAKRLGVSRQSVDALLNGRRGISPEMAKRMELTFGAPAALLLRYQNHYDIWKVEQRADELAKSVTPFEWPDRP